MRTSPPFDRLNSSRPQANSPENGSRRRAISRQIGCVTDENQVSKLPRAPSRSTMWTSTRLDGSATGSVRRRTALTTSNSAVLAPMPSASERIATSAKPGLRRKPAQRVAHVLRRLLEPAPAPHVARRLAGSASRCPARGGPRRPRPRGVSPRAMRSAVAILRCDSISSRSSASRSFMRPPRPAWPGCRPSRRRASASATARTTSWRRPAAVSR